MSEPVIIIGAGLGGLSAAIHMASAGRQVIVLEQNAAPGGKMGEFRQEGFRWDTGPSVITLRPALEGLFHSAGHNLEDYLDLEAVEPLTRYFYPDGVRLDATRDLPKMLAQIEELDERDVQGYLNFLAYAARLHRITGPTFIYDQPPTLRSFLKVSPWDIPGVDGLRNMHQAQRGFVHSPHLQQLLGRFATYVGASPYVAPATLNVIAHVELNAGVWYPRGGIYRLAEAYAQLAQELGVEIRTHCPVAGIDTAGGRVNSVRLSDGERLPASAVIANVDVATVYEKLLPPFPVVRKRLGKLERQEPSCSGFALLLGVRGLHPGLAHHNIFFSGDYRREFEQIFAEGRPPDEPTIYIAITSRSTPEDAPPGCENWFVLVNAPALGDGWDWEREGEAYGERLLGRLAQCLTLHGVGQGGEFRERLLIKKVMTPADIARLTGARRGALYGASSNSRWAAFRRPHNRCAEVRGLYFAGGTTHPGGGVPMVTLSGNVASQLLLADGY
jgi:phytoene desaturase